MSKSKEKPKKPTEPFGYISFSKSGKAKKRMFELSSDKETQEAEVAEKFIESHNKQVLNFEIKQQIKLPEKDHDFLFETSKGKIFAQITELVQRSYAFPMTQDEFDNGIYQESIYVGPTELPLGVDIEKRDFALKSVIENKINMHYSKPKDSELWLIVFSVTQYLTEYFEAGVFTKSPGLEIAQEYLRTCSTNPFDQIWYLPPITRAVKVWSC